MAAVKLHTPLTHLQKKVFNYLNSVNEEQHTRGQYLEKHRKEKDWCCSSYFSILKKAYDNREFPQQKAQKKVLAKVGCTITPIKDTSTLGLPPPVIYRLGDVETILQQAQESESTQQTPNKQEDKEKEIAYLKWQLAGYENGWFERWETKNARKRRT